MRTRRIPIAVATLAAASVLTACSSDPSIEQSDPVRLIQDYYTLLSKPELTPDDLTVACETLAFQATGIVYPNWEESKKTACPQWLFEMQADDFRPGSSRLGNTVTVKADQVVERPSPYTESWSCPHTECRFFDILDDAGNKGAFQIETWLIDGKWWLIKG